MNRVSLHVDPATVTGAIRPLHGVNNGPIAFGGLVDVSDYHRELRLPHVRLHDCGWPHPAVVDVPTIFPDWQKDADDPASYTFAPTDDYLAAIVALSPQIIYRLGTSIEHTPRKYHTAPPPDFAKWADICVHIVRHYNEGWADGFHHGIRYWEIWNEPEIGEAMWSGTIEQYIQLYAVAARALKAHDPTLRVGGPAAAYPRGPFLSQFLTACVEQSLPLDFCSWHTYTADPRELAARCRYVRDLLDGLGLRGVESQLNEWNYAFAWRDVETRLRSFQALQGPVGASFAVASLILFQDCPLDQATYYTGDTQWFGLFDPYGAPRKTYYAFRAFVSLLDTPQRVACAREGDAEVAAWAGVAAEGRPLHVLVSNWGAETVALALRLRWAGEMRVQAVDANHDLAEVRRQAWPADGMWAAEMPGHTVWLIELR